MLGNIIVVYCNWVDQKVASKNHAMQQGNAQATYIVQVPKPVQSDRTIRVVTLNRRSLSTAKINLI